MSCQRKPRCAASTIPAARQIQLSPRNCTLTGGGVPSRHGQNTSPQAVAPDEDESRTLHQWARRPKTAQRLALRARIVLACAGGATHRAVAGRAHPPMFLLAQVCGPNVFRMWLFIWIRRYRRYRAGRACSRCCGNQAAMTSVASDRRIRKGRSDLRSRFADDCRSARAIQDDRQRSPARGNHRADASKANCAAACGVSQDSFLLRDLDEHRSGSGLCHELPGVGNSFWPTTKRHISISGDSSRLMPRER